MIIPRLFRKTPDEPTRTIGWKILCYFAV